MNAMIELTDLYSVFADGKKKGGGGQGAAIAETGRVRKQMQTMADALRAGETLDLMTSPLSCGYRTVVTLETQYLKDPALSDLVDGTFRVLGKVTRVVKEGEGSINLLRKTALSRMPQTAMQPFMDVFSGLAQNHGFAFPEIEWEIDGPVIQLLPVAIFA